jgi:hypothetical protein
VTLETAGLLIHGAAVIGALLLASQIGLVVVALTLVAHGVWDVRHPRRHRDVVSPSPAQACVALARPGRSCRARRRARLSPVRASVLAAQGAVGRSRRTRRWSTRRR